MKENIRKSNFELLRILCMMMIVTLHTLGHGGALKTIDIFGTNFIIATFLKSLAIVAVNCYILISGFFGINSNFKFNKALALYIQVFFYSVIISLIFWATGMESINLQSILQTIFPITMQTWWFMSVFMILYLLTPYINKVLKLLTFKEFNVLVIILILTFVVWPSVPKLKPIDIQGGYSLYSFILLYTIGAYISMFYKDKVFNKFAMIGLYLLSTTALTVYNVSTSRSVGHNAGEYSYNFVLIVLSSLALFLFFKEIKIQSNVINKLSALTLGVYLIHDHGYVRSYIYKALGYKNYFNSSHFILYTLMMVLVIYFGASLIEFLRQLLFMMIIKLKYAFFIGGNSKES